MKKCCFAIALIFLSHFAIGQKKISHRAYPGLRLDVQKSWLIKNPREANENGILQQISLTGIVDLWKESSLSCGVSYATFKSDQFRDVFRLYEFPLNLRKYFNPERKGINVATSIIPGWGVNAEDGFSIFFGNEIGYQFNFPNVSMITGFMIQFNGTDNGNQISDTVHLGIFVQGMVFNKAKL